MLSREAIAPCVGDRCVGRCCLAAMMRDLESKSVVPDGYRPEQPYTIGLKRLVLKLHYKTRNFIVVDKALHCVGG